MNKILFVDTLTTGLDTGRCAIYRIGGVFCEEDGMDLKEKCRFDLSMRPADRTRIYENALWQGGISRATLCGYPPQSAAFNDFFSLTCDEISLRNPRDKVFICGFNVAAFDIPFIRGWFEANDNRHFRDCFYVQCLDIMNLAAYALIKERSMMEDFHMETVARYLDVVPTKGPSYSCLDNALTCVDMYMSIRRRAMQGIEMHHRTTEKTVVNLRK